MDLANAGNLKDILSNALIRGLKIPKRDVALFLDGAQDRYANGPELLKAAAVHFKLAEDVLAAKVEKYKHCNCKHPVPSALHPDLQVDPHPHPECTINLELAGKMNDVMSNALLLGLSVPERDVVAFLDGAGAKFEDGPELFKAAAVHFKMSEDTLAAEVLKFKHCNCKHPGGGEAGGEVQQRDDGLPVSAFAKDVTLHVILHELGHALIREFDIPVLGNEETVADAFATYYLTTHLPDRALDVLTARTTSLMIEAGEAAGMRVDWGGEHDHDARRANQIAALAVAADPVKYKQVADIVGMSEKDIEDARDYGGEIRRSWRRVLGPLWMPEGATSAEARVIYDDGSAFLIRLCEDGLASEIDTAIKGFDWHSQVTIRFVDGDGGAGWNRSGRTITVHSAYVRRFIQQGGRGLPARSN
ncbi:MAG: hypothetical protein H7Y88_10500 [Phycisphaerales bacterium]|nr:hypothetical protein [Phycisphaerales bacterium]